MQGQIGIQSNETGRLEEEDYLYPHQGWFPNIIQYPFYSTYELCPNRSLTRCNIETIF